MWEEVINVIRVLQIIHASIYDYYVHILRELMLLDGEDVKREPFLQLLHDTNLGKCLVEDDVTDSVEYNDDVVGIRGTSHVSIDGL